MTTIESQIANLQTHIHFSSRALNPALDISLRDTLATLQMLADLRQIIIEHSREPNTNEEAFDPVAEALAKLFAL
jgi:hypothetical protein